MVADKAFKLNAVFRLPYESSFGVCSQFLEKERARK